MQLMRWSEHFETHLSGVDAQHRALVDMVNAAAPHLALDTAQARANVGPLLDNLTRYAAVHFRDEEALMVQHQLDPAYIAHHRKTHEAFVQEVLTMRAQWEQAGNLSGPELLRFLGSWLSFHILMEDQRMARQVAAMAQGASAAQAYAQVSRPESGAQAVFTETLLDLFGQLSKRNQKLSATVAELQAARVQLQAANQTLEQRVQARTQDLSAALQQLKQTQAQLLQSDKMAAVGQLAAGVAHEINNPIGFVTSNLGTLADYVAQLLALIDAQAQVQVHLPAPALATVQAVEQTLDLAFVREDLPKLLTESREGLARVRRIVEDLRNFSRADDGAWQQADLNALVESALGVVANALKGKAEVVRQLQPELPPVHCLSAQLSQVLVNLLVNAAQAITTHGSVSVRTGTLASGVWLEVADTGCGMTEEVQKRMFEPFFTTKPVGQGTGLGLSITWEILQRHRAQVAVRSAPGQGTTIHIDFPADPSPRTPHV